MKNTTKYIRTPKDLNHPYCLYDAKLWNLTSDELLIMLCIFSNKTEIVNEDDQLWIVNRIEIQNRLIKMGMSHIKFRKAWMSLEKKHYINKKQYKGYVEWIIIEDPNMNKDITPQTNVNIDNNKSKKDNTIILPTSLSPREKNIAIANKDYYLRIYNIDITKISDNELTTLYYNDKIKNKK